MIDTRAEVPKFAFLALGVARLAAASTMPDEPVGEERPLILGNQRHEIPLHLDGITLGRHPESPGESADMGVDDDTFIDVKGVPQNDIGGLATCSENGREFLHAGRDFAGMAFHKGGTHASE